MLIQVLEQRIHPGRGLPLREGNFQLPILRFDADGNFLLVWHKHGRSPAGRRDLRLLDETTQFLGFC
jgi:hypothetical protein